LKADMAARKKTTRRKKVSIDPEQISEGWWDEIERDWQLTPTHRMLVAAGRQAWQRWREATRLVDKGGLIISGKKGVGRINPALTVESRTREALVKVLSYLDLGQPEEG
jgi:phage terminase small subunit